MSADFPLKSDLPIEDQLEIDRIQAIPEARRTAAEQAYLDAREIYLTNRLVDLVFKAGDQIPNATTATGTLAFQDRPTDSEIVRIGAEVYEFDDDDDVEAGNIAVDISGTANLAEDIIALKDAIEASTSEEINVGWDSNNLIVTAANLGPIGNGIVTTTTCADADWGGNDTLVEGQFGVGGSKFDFYWLEPSSLYMAFADNDITDANWMVVATNES